MKQTIEKNLWTDDAWTSNNLESRAIPTAY